MNEKKINPFFGYEYKQLTLPTNQASWYINCYECFGWEKDENMPVTPVSGSAALCMALIKPPSDSVTLHLKRDRKLVNIMELTRLQRNFEACAQEIDSLEQLKTRIPFLWAIIIGVVGAAFMAGSVFAHIHEPPLYVLSTILAVPGFACWIASYYVYRHKLAKQQHKLQPLIEAKHEQVYEICEKGHALLYK